MALTFRPIIWLGNSRKNVQEFPKQVRVDMGTALMAAQCGEMAGHIKPFKGVGSGVFEIAERYDKDAYRLVYAVQIGEHIYVLQLHAFQKKSKSGIATPKSDVDLIRRRYREAQERAEND